MSGIITRSRAPPRIPTQEATTSRDSARTKTTVLSVDQKKILETFTFAFIKKYENTTPPTEWKYIISYLKKIHKLTLKEYQTRVKRNIPSEQAVEEIMNISYGDTMDDPFAKRWRQISLDLMKNDFEYIDPIIRHITSVRKQLEERFTKNFNIEQILPEGNVRLNVFKNFTYKEYLQQLGKKKLVELNDAQKVDLIMLLNDPTSKTFESLLQEIASRSYATAKELIMLRVDEIKFYVNTHKGDGVTVLMKCLFSKEPIGSPKYRDLWALVVFLINHGDIDLTIPVNIKDKQINVISTLLYSYYIAVLKATNDKDFYSDALEEILKKKPMTAFYRSDLEEDCFGKVYGSVITEDGKKICIGNVWIFRHLRQDMINVLVENGKLDMKVGYETANVRRSLHIEIDDLKESKKKAHEVFTETKKSVQKLYDTIIKLNEDYKDLLEVRNATQLDEITVGKEIEKLEQKYTSLEPFFEEHKINLYFGGKKKTVQKKLSKQQLGK